MFSSISESHSLDYFAGANKCAVFLLAGVRAKTIPRVDLEFNNVSVEMLAFRAEVDRLWIALPLNLCARGIKQPGRKPLGHDLFVIGGIRSIARNINRFVLRRQTTRADRQNQYANRRGGLREWARKKLTIIFGT